MVLKLQLAEVLGGLVTIQMVRSSIPDSVCLGWAQEFALLTDSWMLLGDADLGITLTGPLSEAPGYSRPAGISEQVAQRRNTKFVCLSFQVLRNDLK